MRLLEVVNWRVGATFALLINLLFLEYIVVCEVLISAKSTYSCTGVPLIDGGTIRLPRLIGLSRAMDIILTGYNLWYVNITISRDVPAIEAIEIGLANYMASPGQTALLKSLEIAKILCSHPQQNLRNDRLSVLANYDWPGMLTKELGYGLDTLKQPLPQVTKFTSKL